MIEMSRPVFILLLTLLIGVAAACGPKEDLYREYVQPEGKYRIVVLRQPTGFAMPGQGSDAPGIVRLMDEKGIILEEQTVEMVQLVDQVDWSRNHVSIKNVADWPLGQSNN